MEKYLFTDGTNLVREVQSNEELHTLIEASAVAGKIRIWVFSTSEWISHTEFSKRSVAKIIPLKDKITTIKEPVKPQTVVAVSRQPRKYTGIIKFFIAVLTGAAIFLVYNFSRVKWHTASALQITASRPANSPLVNVDSLVQTIEAARGQKLDKVTHTNLRIRNSWPDRIELQLKTDRDTSQAGTKFYNVEIFIDNSTGYNIDNAVVELRSWKNTALNSVDTFQLSNIGYAELSNRKVDTEYRGDSLSVSFLSIKAKSFNFCYAYDKESNYGNFNDRWFCRD
jgi:hypothetical protein